jgi:hypothetical protein
VLDGRRLVDRTGVAVRILEDVVVLGILTAGSYSAGWGRKAAMEDILIFFISRRVRILHPLLCYDRKPHDGR